MFPSIIATILWSYCLIPARKAVAMMGENAANFWRLFVAVIVMGILSVVGQLQLGQSAVGWLFLSGIIGFGFGDIGVWFALPRIGSRLTLLMAQCVAVPLAGIAEWIWLGTTISSLQILSIAIILPGVSMALFSKKEREVSGKRRYVSGILFGLLAALGQSLGAVCSRKAFLLISEEHFDSANAAVSDYIFLGVSSGFSRLVGGILIAGLFWFLSRYIPAIRTKAEEGAAAVSLGVKSKNILLCAAAGPIVGVIFYQWALATTPSVIVQMIVSISPIVILPMTWFHEGDRPSLQSILGTLIAVAGVLILAFS